VRLTHAPTRTPHMSVAPVACHWLFVGFYIWHVDPTNEECSSRVLASSFVLLTQLMEPCIAGHDAADAIERSWAAARRCSLAEEALPLCLILNGAMCAGHCRGLSS
jgi:hypothetical protein